jgi:hypothetical protein
VLVLGGIHVVAERVSGRPELGLEAEGGAGVVLGFRFGHLRGVLRPVRPIRGCRASGAVLG